MATPGGDLAADDPRSRSACAIGVAPDSPPELQALPSHLRKIVRNYPTRKGFPSLSSPMVVCGPWPGITTVSSGRVEYAVAQGAHDLFERASGEIGAPDASGEQGIARD